MSIRSAAPPGAVAEPLARPAPPHPTPARAVPSGAGAAPSAWRLLAVTATFTYVGGIAIFTLHAIVLGEAGPPVADSVHWFLDATVGLLALAPPLVLVVRRLPAAWWQRLHPARLVAVVFTALTVPGPVLHHRLLGRDTPLGRALTEVFGPDPAVLARQAGADAHPSAAALVRSCVLQAVVGLVVYGVLAHVVVRRTPGRLDPVPSATQQGAPHVRLP